MTAGGDRRPATLSLCRTATAILLSVLVAACIPLPGPWPTAPPTTPQITERPVVRPVVTQPSQPAKEPSEEPDEEQAIAQALNDEPVVTQPSQPAEEQAIAQALNDEPGVTQPSQPAKEPTEEPDEEQAIAQALNDEPGITVAEDDPRMLANRAESLAPQQAVPLLLRAIDGFIRQNQPAAAQSLIVRLQYLPMAGFQRHGLMLHQAHLAQTLGQHEHALEWLRALEQTPSLSAQTRARLLRLRADSEQTLGRNDAAVATRLQLDNLPEPAGRVANQRHILDLIESLDSLGRLLLQENPDDDAAGDILSGWVALSEVLQSESPAERIAAIRQWRTLYPGHPASPRLFNQHLLVDDSVATHPRHIALLLPLTSKFGEAAHAFYDGFMAARNDDSASDLPTVSWYDIGTDPQLVSLYYGAAVNDGVDFIVGPLGQRAVDALLKGAPPPLPVLLVGSIPEAQSAPNWYGISLSPEQEARQVAMRAFADGHRQAGIFRSDSHWGQRVADAFAEQWELLGATLVDDTSFSDDSSDHPRIIQQLLGLDQSIKRKRILDARLGIKLEFTPRRRHDIDFLFLAANAEQARQLVPQLRFYQAHDLALYATSEVYDDKPDPAIDADLDGIIFGDMNWILDAAVLPQPQPEPESAESWSVQPPGREPGAYYHTDLDRLYALGLESYQVIPALDTLRRNPQLRYFGAAMDLGVKADGNVLRHLTWAQFARGLPVVLPPTIPSTTPGQ